jgi:phage terminase large subunit-like protein
MQATIRFKDETCWVKANPALDVTITPRYLRDQVREAQGMPAKASIVQRLNFCVWVDAENPAIDQDAWRKVAGTFVYTDNAGVEPVGALDLSGVRDLTALGLLWPGEPWRAAVEFWTPEEGLAERAKRDRVPYDLWVQQGHVVATPGRSVNYRWVAIRLGELQQEIGLRRVAFDAYRIKYLERELEEENVDIELVPHGQGFYKAAESGLWMPRSIEIIEERITKGTVVVKANPALNFAAASAVMEEDPKGNRVFTKRKSRGRIDGHRGARDVRRPGGLVDRSHPGRLRARRGVGLSRKPLSALSILAREARPTSGGR